jgi:hypothetical protein
MEILADDPAETAGENASFILYAISPGTRRPFRHARCAD